jgi:hypothetical protein
MEQLQEPRNTVTLFLKCINSFKLPVNILVDRVGEVVVDDLLDVVDVESSGRHRRRHQDGFPLSFEVLQGLLSLPLVSEHSSVVDNQ